MLTAASLLAFSIESAGSKLTQTLACGVHWRGFIPRAPCSNQWDLARRPCVALLPAWEQGEIMSKYLLGCLSTLFISHTAGVISFPKFSGKFRLFISSQMFTNLLNIRNASAIPQSKQAPRLITGYSLRRWFLSAPMQYDIILMSPSQRRGRGGWGQRWLWEMAPKRTRRIFSFTSGDAYVAM